MWQAWVAERSTTLTQSARIETAISRGGDKGAVAGHRNVQSFGLTKTYDAGITVPRSLTFAVGVYSFHRRSCASRVVMQAHRDFAGCLRAIAPCPKRGKRRRKWHASDYEPKTPWADSGDGA